MNSQLFNLVRAEFDLFFPEITTRTNAMAIRKVAVLADVTDTDLRDMIFDDQFNVWCSNIEYNYKPYVSRIAFYFGINVEDLFTIRYQFESFHDQVGTHQKLNPASLLEKHRFHATVNETLQTLSPQQARVIRQRFGFHGSEQTLESIALREKVSRERIRQIEAKGLRDLRAPIRAKMLRQAIPSTR